MFIRAWKNKRVCDAVLSQVAPMVSDLSRHAGLSAASLARDKYVLGFFCIMTGLLQRQAAGGRQDPVREGTIMFLVLKTLFGGDNVNEKEIGDLLHRTPEADAQFVAGCEAAMKVHATIMGSKAPALLADPDFIAAKESAKSAGPTLGGAAPGSTEDSRIGAMMLARLLYQPIIERRGATAGSKQGESHGPIA